MTNGKVCSNELPLKVDTNRTCVLEHRRYNCKMYNELETSASLPIQLFFSLSLTPLVIPNVPPQATEHLTCYKFLFLISMNSRLSSLPNTHTTLHTYTDIVYCSNLYKYTRPLALGWDLQARQLPRSASLFRFFLSLSLSFDFRFFYASLTWPAVADNYTCVFTARLRVLSFSFSRSLSSSFFFSALPIVRMPSLITWKGPLIICHQLVIGDCIYHVLPVSLPSFLAS